MVPGTPKPSYESPTNQSLEKQTALCRCPGSGSGTLSVTTLGWMFLEVLRGLKPLKPENPKF